MKQAGIINLQSCKGEKKLESASNTADLGCSAFF